MNTHFRTELLLKEELNSFTYKDIFFSIGSCFAENIGSKLSYFKFQQMVNPFGIIFNPYSIAEVLRCIVDDKQFSTDHFIQNENHYSLDVHSKIAAKSALELQEKLKKIKTEARQQLSNASVVVITLGTAWVYRYLKTNQYVANCQKIPATHFSKELLSVAEIQENLLSIIHLIEKNSSVKNIIFTVSPVRHIKDGFTENSISKAHLLTALNGITHKKVHYFPAYELMMDDLRDYRFYESDMLHPNETAIQYIWEKFVKTWFHASTFPIMKKVDGIQKALQHRPFDAESNAFEKFKEELQNKIEQLQQEEPSIQF